MLKGTGKRVADEVRRLEIDPAALKQTRTLYHRNPMARAARDLLLQTLFSMPLLFKRGESPFAPEATLAAACTEHWVPFAERALDSIMTTGYVVADIAEHHTEPGIPIVAPTDSYRSWACTRGTGFWIETETLPFGAEATIRELITLHDFGSDPTPAGELASRIATLLPGAVWMERMAAMALKCERTRSNPLLVMQQRSGPRGVSEGVQFDSYANAGNNTRIGGMHTSYSGRRYDDGKCRGPV